MFQGGPEIILDCVQQGALSLHRRHFRDEAARTNRILRIPVFRETFPGL